MDFIGRMGDRGVDVPADAAAEPAWRPTPLQALELGETPAELHFIRDHFPVPRVDPCAWTFEITGSNRRMTLNARQIQALPRTTTSVVLECAGHRRTEMRPLPEGLPWACGAVSEARWTGTPIAPLLERAGVPATATELVLEGADSGPFEGRPGTHPFARSVPLEKSLDGEILLAYELNGEPIPVDRGGPVRAIVPGWYATDSVKWLTRAWFTETPFDGPFQLDEYRVRAHDEPPPGQRMTELPVHALITSPADGDGQPAGPTRVRGVAWGGREGIAAVLVRDTLGPWRQARMDPVRDRYTLVGWELPLTLGPGEHLIACRAIDGSGATQPDRPPSNPGGYANNAVHHVRVSVF
jgi:DMSO/TMAO reductase YedYZ molybdopterin-dependent catalytic subunit